MCHLKWREFINPNFILYIFVISFSLTFHFRPTSLPFHRLSYYTTIIRMKHTDMSSLNLRILDTTGDSVNEVIGRYSDGKALEVLKRYLEPGGELLMEQAVKLIDDMLPNPEGRDLHFQLENVGFLILEQAGI